MIHPLGPELIEQLVDLARRAGDAIMVIYRDRDNYQIQHKTDESPLTAADLAANNLIAAELPRLLALPIISEEGEIPEFVDRGLWENFWLVDPLDGTKEFIAGNGEFTVNIALVQHNRPILGVVHVPATDVTYLGVLDARSPASLGAWKYQHGQNPERIHVRNLNERYASHQAFTVLLSHRHGTQATVDLMETVKSRWMGPIETTNAGSSLKFCVIAEGNADFYPRLAPTSEWDTAAAQAVLEAAGGRVVHAEPNASRSLVSLRYNANEDLLNPHFYALGDKSFCWEWLLGLEELVS
ncbi:3'(2'),5'-bisphosphate nucleotidase CysQ [Cellvibrio mixtus]|uniref:3'(2'),5'-bisphosphate nucleotidase CysQ n=1 Tax=Cellvibrio mixtus TaxID=39650 RepID=UPI0005874DF7|nr:3'(2'),5'-bisphosphate nucleotidase CysQ [Cellvibrio mixtus]